MSGPDQNRRPPPSLAMALESDYGYCWELLVAPALDSVVRGVLVCKAIHTHAQPTQQLWSGGLYVVCSRQQPANQPASLEPDEGEKPKAAPLRPHRLSPRSLFAPLRVAVPWEAKKRPYAYASTGGWVGGWPSFPRGHLHTHHPGLSPSSVVVVRGLSESLSPAGRVLRVTSQSQSHAVDDAPSQSPAANSSLSLAASQPRLSLPPPTALPLP